LGTVRDAQVTVRVHQAGHDPPAVADRLGILDRLQGHPVAHQPEIPDLVVGQHHAPHMQRHASFLPDQRSARASMALRRSVSLGRSIVTGYGTSVTKTPSVLVTSSYSPDSPRRNWVSTIPSSNSGSMTQ